MTLAVVTDVLALFVLATLVFNLARRG